MIAAERARERTMIFDAFPLGVPFACAMREDVLRRAFEGDTEAQAIVRAAMPLDVPADLRRQERDRRIRELAGLLWATLPGASVGRVCRILRAAGDALERGRGLSDRPPFDSLDKTGQAFLETQIRDVLAWAPPHAGNRWPATTQLRAIISQ